jgi:signal transduction histidine kinase
VLESVREHADESIARKGSSAPERLTLQNERAREDAALEHERRVADEEVSEARQDRIRALANLLRLEREQTDEQLLIERGRGDAMVAARDDFLAMVSHDLRTLLGGIALHAELQVRNAGEDAAGQRSLVAAQSIQRLVARMNRLIGDLLDVTSIEAGRLAMMPERHDVQPLIRDALQAFQPTASAKGILLEATFAQAPLEATFDHDRILQVLANLLSNAIKFTATGGAIRVRVEPADRELRFCVTDTGQGIAAEHLQAIFERFWQVTGGDRRGLGLGLYISKCIVEAHGGRIWAESDVDQGTAVWFTLPLTGAARQTVSPTPH